MALFAGAGSAFASESPPCDPGPGGNTETCFTFNGSGTHVNDMVTAVTVFESTRTLQVCVSGPDSALPFCSQFQPVAPGASIAILWAPDRNVTPGKYCGRTWRQNNVGPNTKIGEACVNLP